MSDDISCMDMANAIRFLSMDAIQKAKSGHPGMPMGMADVAAVLWTQHLKFDAAKPDWADRDRFVLSAGHGSMLLYSLLYLSGFEEATIDEIRNFRQLHSKMAGHPEYGHLAGVEVTTGPLGSGLATAVGMALAERMLNARYGDDLVDHYTWVIAGDGCLMEGVSHEAIDLAGHLGLNRLIVLWDDNEITIDGKTSVATSMNQIERFDAAGWNTIEVDGHDHDQIDAALAAAKESDRPTFIACKTIIGYGAPNKQGSEATHGAPLGEEEIAAAREKLNWPHAPFGNHEGAGRLPSAAGRGEAEAGDPSGIAEDAGGAGGQPAQPGGRFRRPDALQPHRGEGHEVDRAGRLLRRLHPLRRARVRHGHGHERHRPARRLHQLWRHVPDEDGPTHQPVETIPSLRAMPNLNVFRPADAMETAEAWACAMQSEKTPSALCLSRQGLPALREDAGENMVAKGAYVLREADGGRDVTLLATGSEVSMAIEAADMLAQKARRPSAWAGRSGSVTTVASSA